MKRKSRVKIVILQAMILIMFALNSSNVKAGINAPMLESDTLEDTSKWNNVEGDVEIENGKLIFSEDSSEYTRFISLEEAIHNEVSSKLVSIEGNIKFTKLPQNKNFSIALGLPEIESVSGEAGNVEILFTYKNGLNISVVAYTEDGVATTVCEPKFLGIPLSTAAYVKAEIISGEITVSINGNTVCTGSLPVTGEGKVGFMQSGECAAEISDIKVSFYNYDRPENSNIEEDFEKGGLNIATLILKLISGSDYYPQGNSIEEYNGNHVLFFENSGVSYLGTRYMYSNFEISFDVPYLQTANEYNEYGVVTREKTESFAICIGTEKMDWSTPGYENAAEAIVFKGEEVYSLKNKNINKAVNTLWNTQKAFSVKMSVIDGTVCVQIKGLNETEYKSVLKYQLDKGTPMGYIQFWIPSFANMAIDNLVINNLDNEPNSIDIAFKNGAYEPKDTEYKPFERIYLDESGETQQGQMNAWYWLIPVTVFVGVLALIVTGILSKRRKKTGDLPNEK